MKKIIIYFLSLGLVFCFATAGMAQTIINIGTHPIGSVLNVIGNATAIVIGKHTPMKATVKPMAGPNSWYPLMETGEIDLGLLNCWDAEMGYFGESIYGKLSKGKGFPVRLIAISINNAASLIVATDSGIYKVSDLKGKKVAVVYPVASLPPLIESHLANGGLKLSDIIPLPVSSMTESIKSVIEGRTDASTCTVGMPIIEELHSKKGARILPLDNSPEAVKRTKEKFPGYPFKVTPGPGRTGVEKEQYLWGYDMYLIGRENLPDEIAYNIVKALWENYKEFSPIHVLLKDWTPDRFVTKEALIPYHPEAIKFYKEKGIWTKEMAKLQESLLAKKK
jgi:TRAP transporter TAXI family solute receptor